MGEKARYGEGKEEERERERVREVKERKGEKGREGERDHNTSLGIHARHPTCNIS